MKNTVPIKKNFEFSRVYRKSRFYSGKYLVLYALKNYSQINRLGITVSRKFGNSVKRNRIKRLIRENYRWFENSIKVGYDFVFVARKQEVMPGYVEIHREMKYLLKKLELLNP